MVYLLFENLVLFELHIFIKVILETHVLFIENNLEITVEFVQKIIKMSLNV